MQTDPQAETAGLLFTLELERPGPSEGDAMEHLEHLGFNAWAFKSITLVSEVVRGRMVIATFAVTGDSHEVERLRRVREQLRVSTQHLVEPCRE